MIGGLRLPIASTSFVNFDYTPILIHSIASLFFSIDALLSWLLAHLTFHCFGLAFNMSSTRRTLTQLCRQCTRTQSLHINPPQIRCFSLHTPLSSGHSKWATIKHDKAKVDAARGRTRTMFAAEIAHASRCVSLVQFPQDQV